MVFDHVVFKKVYLFTVLQFCQGTLKSGVEVAVKTLSAQSKQGLREFLTEINTITNVKHPNLVELLGCCVQESNRILVYEYVENNSLDRALLGNSEKTISVQYEIEVCIHNGGLKL